MTKGNAGIKKYVIEGVLRTASPLHITDASAGKMRFKPNQGVFYGDSGGFPVTATRTGKVFVDRDREVDLESAGINGDSGGEKNVKSVALTLPIVPSSTIRGMLRRGAAKVVEDHLVFEKGTKLSYEAYQGMRCGAISGRPEKVGPTTEEIRAARQHVFYGIFGGGPRMLRGQLRAADAWPVVSELVNHSDLLPQTDIISEMRLRGVRPSELTQVLQVVRKDDFYGGGGNASVERASEVVENFDARYDAEREVAVQSAIDRTKKGDGDGGKDSEGGDDKGYRGVTTLNFTQVVIPGVPFYFRVTIEGTEAQVGLLLQAFERALTKGIGGRDSHNYGRMSGILSVVVGGASVPALRVMPYEVEVLAGVSSYMEAAAEAINALTLDDINRYMQPLFVGEAESKGRVRKQKKEEVTA